MIYDKERVLAQMSIQNWLSNEVFSFGWFLMLGILIILYAVWLKLLDKQRATQLLLIGSLAAVFYHINFMFMIDFFGLFHYMIRLIPIHTPAFASSVTIAPITIMLVQQYTSSWKGYILWSAIGIAFINFVIFPLYTLIGILEFHNWNVFYHFLVMLVISLITRLVFLWITGTQKRLPTIAK